MPEGEKPVGGTEGKEESTGCVCVCVGGIRGLGCGGVTDRNPSGRG